MRSHSLVISATLIAALVLALAVIAFAADNPFIGTWKEDIAKTKITPSSAAAKSFTIKIVPEGDGFRITADYVTADGKALHMEWSGKFDGKDYPATGDPNADTYALKKIDSNTLVEVDKKAGKEFGTWRLVVSKDGKTMTSTGTYKDEKGQNINITSVFNKQ